MAKATYTYDVFIAYSTDDRSWVRSKLLPRLEESGLKVCIDYRDFQRNAAVVSEIERALHTSRKTVLVLSPHFQASEWSQLETCIHHAGQTHALEHIIIPVLREIYPIPTSVNRLTYVDFTLPKPDDRTMAWTQLLTALGSPPPLEPPDPPMRDTWLLVYPYPMPPNFTGRVYERDQLNAWLNADYAYPLLVMQAPSGAGKTALSWQWLTRDIHPYRWRKVVWWSCYEGESSFEHFLVRTLEYLGIPDAHTLGIRQQADELLRLLCQPVDDMILLVLDGFERILHAYTGMGAAYHGDVAAPSDMSAEYRAIERSCINPVADYLLHALTTTSGVWGKIVITTRLLPRAIENDAGEVNPGCRVLPLPPVLPDNAVDFLRAQGMRGNRTAIEQVCHTYEYHSLSLALLAGLINNDIDQPGDVTIASHLDMDMDTNIHARQHAILDRMMQVLPAELYAPLSCIACFRQPASYAMLKELVSLESLVLPGQQRKAEDVSTGMFETVRKKVAEFWSLLRDNQEMSVRDKHETLRELQSLTTYLRDLVTRGLILYDKQARRYDMHPVVRHYVYTHLNYDVRLAIHRGIHTCLATNPDYGTGTDGRLTDLLPAIDMYHHAVCAEDYDNAYVLFQQRLSTPLCERAGYASLCIELLQKLFLNTRDLRANLTQTAHIEAALNDLAMCYDMLGQPLQALPLYAHVLHLVETRNDTPKLAAVLLNQASHLIRTGSFTLAETTLRRCIAFAHEQVNLTIEAAGHDMLGVLLTYRGFWNDAESEYTRACAFNERQPDIWGQASVWAHRALCAAMHLRHTLRSPPTGNAASEQGDDVSDMAHIPAPLPGSPEDPQQRRRDVTTAAHRTLDLVAEAPPSYRIADTACAVQAHLALAILHRLEGTLDDAMTHISTARSMCNQRTMRSYELPVLIELARVQMHQHAYDEAHQSLRAARTIAKLGGDVLSGADMHLVLAQIAHEQGHWNEADEHARAARAAARCDGPPNYTYKVAYDEASALTRRRV